MGADTSRMETARYAKKRTVLERWRKRKADTQLFGVVRHAERADGVYAFYDKKRWSQTPDFLEWPLDPPLSDDGLIMARDLGKHVQQFEHSSGGTLDVVVTSPYFRCVQTAVFMCKSMLSEKPKGIRLLVDYSLGEVFGPKVMGPEPKGPIVRGMDWIIAYCKDEGVSVVPKPLGRWPQWGETIKSARKRYIFRFLSYLQRCEITKRNFLLVSHGDCVASVVATMPSEMGKSVAKVEFGGHLLAKRKVRSKALPARPKPNQVVNFEAVIPERSIKVVDEDTDACILQDFDEMPDGIHELPDEIMVPTAEVAVPVEADPAPLATPPTPKVGSPKTPSSKSTSKKIMGMMNRPKVPVRMQNWIEDAFGKKDSVEKQNSLTIERKASSEQLGGSTGSSIVSSRVYSGWRTQISNIVLSRRPEAEEIHAHLKKLAKQGEVTQERLMQLLGTLGDEPLAQEELHTPSREPSLQSFTGAGPIVPTCHSFSTYIFGTTESEYARDRDMDVLSDKSDLSIGNTESIPSRVNTDWELERAMKSASSQSQRSSRVGSTRSAKQRMRKPNNSEWSPPNTPRRAQTLHSVVEGSTSQHNDSSDSAWSLEEEEVDTPTPEFPERAQTQPLRLDQMRQGGRLRRKGSRDSSGSDKKYLKFQDDEDLLLSEATSAMKKSEKVVTKVVCEGTPAVKTRSEGTPPSVNRADMVVAAKIVLHEPPSPGKGPPVAIEAPPLAAAPDFKGKEMSSLMQRRQQKLKTVEVPLKLKPPGEAAPALSSLVTPLQPAPLPAPVAGVAMQRPEPLSTVAPGRVVDGTDSDAAAPAVVQGQGTARGTSTLKEVKFGALGGSSLLQRRRQEAK